MNVITLLFLLMASYVHAQIPSTNVRRDSLPVTPDAGNMPNVRPNNSFYRAPGDPDNVVRATLDNMPIKVPDSSTRYSIQQMPGTYRRQNRPGSSIPKITPTPK
ncbi:hypothetical protein [Spirosoma terrae]|uniref:Uncharacterized protein n=1 Tax=Spirosoma terrae TaxID=1968276 RepID=A0A6L9L4R3_9BACT|nr:hypothetical protein [Spirosoma terrae]NDU95440.1 hypothetical protein [Spirosoma terrae]